MNANLCESCWTQSRDQLPPSFDVADTGTCGQCQRVGEVWDPEMLALLRSLGLSDQQIWESPFRLFDPHLSGLPAAGSKRAVALVHFCAAAGSSTTSA